MCRKTDTPLFSQAYVAAPGAVLTFEFSFRTNPVALFTWGQGKGWGCHGNPCRWSDPALGETSTGRGRGNSSASLFSSSSLIETVSLLSPSSVNLPLSLSLLLLQSLATVITVTSTLAMKVSSTFTFHFLFKKSQINKNKQNVQSSLHPGIYLSWFFPPKNHYKSKKLNVRTKYNIKRSPNIVHPPYSLIISTFHIRECQTYLVKLNILSQPFSYNDNHKQQLNVL